MQLEPELLAELAERCIAASKALDEVMICLLKLRLPSETEDKVLLDLARREAGIPRDGYEANDPKHPDYHSVRADLWDMREKG